MDNITAPEPLQKVFFDVYHNVAFAYIVNHGILADFSQLFFSALRRFHALHQEAKMEIAVDHKRHSSIAIGTSIELNPKLANVVKPNQSATYMMMHEDKAQDKVLYLFKINQWPS